MLCPEAFSLSSCGYEGGGGRGVWGREGGYEGEDAGPLRVIGSKCIQG